MFSRTHDWLKRRGEGIAQFFLGALGLVLLIGVPIAGAAFALYLGWLAAGLLGGGLATILIVGYVVLLLGAVYVWSPYIQPALLRANEALNMRNR